MLRNYKHAHLVEFIGTAMAVERGADTVRAERVPVPYPKFVKSCPVVRRRDCSQLAVAAHYHDNRGSCTIGCGCFHFLISPPRPLLRA